MARSSLRTLFAGAAAAVTLWSVGPAPDAAAPAASARAAAPPHAGRAPNVIVILADDLGHNDISLNGNPLLKTPSIDAIAREGVVFPTGYSGDAVCAPSRAALLTGRDPQRFGFEFLPNEPGFARNVSALGAGRSAAVFDDEAPDAETNGLARSELTLADLMKRQGYATGAVGKWHLGRAPALNPVNRGFDSFVGIIGGAALHAPVGAPGYVDFHIPGNGNDANLWRRADHKIVRGLGPPEEAPGYMADVYAQEAGRFIHANRAKPFFLYLAFDEPHMPLQAPRAFYDRLAYIKDERTRVYYAMIEALDAAVGRVMAQLKADGLDRDTLVVFTSDNGGSPFPRIPQMNLPYRGWKLTYFEGGVNVPFFARWPGHIPAGSVAPGVVSQLDITPTAVAAARGRLPTDRAYDGVDLLPAITRGETGGLDERELVWRKGHYTCIRKGSWKLQLSEHPHAVWLHDLAHDPTERINLATTMPAKVAELRAALDTRQRDFRAPAWKPQGRLRVDIDGTPTDPSVPREYVEWTN